MRFMRIFLLLAALVFVSSTTHTALAAGTVCPRAHVGALVTQPPEISSLNGELKLTLKYETRTDPDGRTLFCFTTTDGQESPTLRVNPGDKVNITLINDLPPGDTAHRGGMHMFIPHACNDEEMTTQSVNIHFHGMNISPTCHSDEVLRTTVNPGETFNYSFNVPNDEPPGLYWYHPHIHGISTQAVSGGASGAIIVEGIQNLQPIVSGLPERLLVIREQAVPGVVLHGEPNADLTLNYVPINYPNYKPATIDIKPGQSEFWRVLNAASDTVMDLQLRYDGKRQPLQIVALDGVPTGSQDGTKQGKGIKVDHILIPPAGRAEFIITGPSTDVASARFETRAIDTGPAGDADPARPLATLVTNANAMPAGLMGRVDAAPGGQRFADLEGARTIAKRKLYFSEVPLGQGDGQINFFITVDGARPILYDPANPPAITTYQGAVEDWTIENRSTENHEFHIHQIHFKLMERNGEALNPSERQMLDTVQVPYWSGKGPYPSVTLRMDFRGHVVGDFVYHCHILDHEDNGMMAIIRVLPKAGEIN